MANKLDTEKALFLGNNAVREDTTFGQIRKSVAELDQGEGVSYADLEAHMLANFTPTKSTNYGASYVKAYVRDAVNKFGYLSHENLGVEYSAVEPAPKATAAPKPKAMTKAAKAKVEMLSTVRTLGEVGDVSEVNDSKVTVETLVQETKKKTKTVEKMVKELEEEGFARTEQVEESTYVFLTEAGLAHVNEHSAPEADNADAMPESAAAETVAEDDDSAA